MQPVMAVNTNPAHNLDNLSFIGIVLSFKIVYSKTNDIKKVNKIVKKTTIKIIVSP